MDTSGLQGDSIPALSSMRLSLKDCRVVAGRRVSKELAGKEIVVAIPLLNVIAYGDRVPPQENISLSEAEVEEVLLAPLAWCPNPENMISMHLEGDSMYPAISPDSIIFVDTSVKDRDRLHHRLTVVSHRDLGFKVARFQRLSGFDLLVSANHKYPPVDVSNASKWKIFGEVLWWISKDIGLDS
jgi:SOS-response transcriptional repressor LexA